MLTKKSIGLLAASLAVVLIVVACLLVEAGPTILLPVLVYHHLQETVQSDVSCTPEQFESHIMALQKAGFTPLTMNQARLFLAGALDNVARPILITFDDGYASLYKYALPVARKFKVPMSVFVVTSRIGRKPQFARYLSETQIKEMAESGLFDFGSHTHDLHTDSLRILEAFGPGADNPVLFMINRDLRLSSARLEAITGHRPEALAWPYGKFNHNYSAIARQNNFILHFTSASGYNEPNANPYAIKRIPVTARDNVVALLRKARGRSY